MTNSTETAQRTVNGARPTKGNRRTKDEMNQIRTAIVATLVENPPMTVRQVFYQLVNQGVIEKTEGEYKTTVGRLLTKMRLDGDIPFDWLADGTRWMRKPTTYSSMEQALRRTAEMYRRSLWDRQESYVEVWLEKEALAGVLYDVTEEWDVPLMVTRGYGSLSFLYNAAETITAYGKPTYLYYFGDYDPSGVDISRNVHERIIQFTDVPIHFERVAVTPEQIDQWQLPTRPTKKTDSRSRSFSGESVEVDAIPPAQLRLLAEERILQHVDRDALEPLLLAEESERELLQKIAAEAS